MIDWEIGKFLKVVLITQLTMWITIVLDVPVARQVIGFIYLTFIPGIILLRVFRIHEINAIETLLFSVGLSIAFSMFVGLSMNEIYPIIGILKPLSPQIISTTIIIITLVLSTLVYIIDRHRSSRVATELKLRKSVLLLPCLPILSIFAAILLKNSGNNSLSLLLVIVVSGLIVLGVLSKKIISPVSYPWVLLSVAISLLLLMSFTSAYIIGFDIHTEYYVFRLTQTNSHWSSIIPGLELSRVIYDDMLSITILPTIYSYMLNLDGAWVLKVVYLLIFSLMSLGLYQIYRRQFGERIAFLSTFFFFSVNTFFQEMLGLARQMIAELFFVLLILLLLDRKISKWKRIGLSTIFGAALVVSHYSVSYMFMFLIFPVVLFLPLVKNVKAIRNRTLTWSYVLIYFTIAYLWYTYTSNSATLIAVANVGKQISSSIYTEFLAPAARSSEVMKAMGMTGSVSPIHEVGRVIFQLVQFFVLAGFVTVILKRREMKLDPEYYLMSLFGMAILVMCIVLPYLASSLMMQRIYHIVIIILAPFFALGGDTLLGWIPKLKRFKLPIISIVLIVFFLFQCGFIYEVTGDIPSWGALSSYRINPRTNLTLYVQYVHEQDVFSATWLSQKRAYTSKIYADMTSNYHVLTSYGMLPPEYQHNWSYLLSNSTRDVDEGAYIYLGNLNVEYGLVEGPGSSDLWNITDISPFLNKCNIIYSNGGSSIYMGRG